MKPLPFKIHFRAGAFAAVVIVGIVVILFALRARTSPQGSIFLVSEADREDRLAYVSADDRLMVYDPRARTETALLDGVQEFVMGRDGRVAFTRLDESDPGLYVFDPATSAIALIASGSMTTGEDPAMRNHPRAWSPDGRHLAFTTNQDRNDQTLFLWDGETLIDVMPDNGLGSAAHFFVTWSQDGRLAFTVTHGWSSLDIPEEIYVWDGNATFNLSQNPDGWDSTARWSENGQLMFSSRRDGEDGIYVWDGVSFKDGVPDVNTFIRVAPELQPVDPTWTADGLVGFTTYLDDFTHG